MADHHFVPRFYLEGFCAPDTPPGRTAHLWVFRKGESGWRKRAPHNVAKSSKLYTITDEAGREHEMLEGALGTIESAVAPLFRSKIPDCLPFTREDREHFAAFVAHMMGRTPTTLKQVARVYGEEQRKQFRARVRAWKASPETWRAFVVWFNSNQPPQNHLNVDRDPMELDMPPDRFDLRVDAKQVAALSLVAAFESIPPILAMGWAFFRSDPPDFVITSDNPLARVNPDAGVLDAGLGARGTEISLPLNRTQFFMASNEWTGTLMRLAPGDLVQQINLRTAARADTYFAPSPLFPGSALLNLPPRADTPGEDDLS